MKILGIETSCDETAAAVVELSSNGKSCKLLSNVVSSSMDLHAVYGGVVPEIAARSHIESILPVIDQALKDAFYSHPSSVISHQSKNKEQATGDLRLATQSDLWDQIDGVAVTYGAGLGGSLLIGVITARTLSTIKNKPLYGINHVEAHLYSNFITEQRAKSREQSSYQLLKQVPVFPILGLIVSGGHTQLVLFKDHFNYKLLGQTHDDAIGEAFDKVAKMLGLPYPGGPSIAESAKKGNPLAYDFPKSKLSSKYDFSFSGIKTAVLRTAQAEIGEDYAFPSHKLPDRLSEAQKANIAASFQSVAIETIVDKTVAAYEEFNPKSVIVGGGVAANKELREQLAKRLPIALKFQDIKLMGDNGAMVAALGCYKSSLKQQPSDPYKLDIFPNLSM